MDDSTAVFDPQLAARLGDIERRLQDEHARRVHGRSTGGDMPWWPAGFARTPAARAFEIAVGAVLTQNTNWRNVERALANLERVNALDVAVVRALPDERLAELIRPSGFYRIKTGRLKALAAAWQAAGGHAVLAGWDTEALRDWLLGIHGVGRETADDILLYGFARPVWVIDAYSRRLLGRLGFEQLAALPYDELAARLLAHTGEPTAERLAAWHGLIVEHAKAWCRPNPVCRDCPLRPACRHGREANGAGA
jgi:endonuclease-3 related protein